jgi:hypothetical protein
MSILRPFVALIFCFSSFASSAGNVASEELFPQPFVDYAQRVEKIERNWSTVLGVRDLYVAKAYEDAFKLAQSADRSDSPHFAYWLGRMYFEGRGVAKDAAEAQRLLRVADREGLGYASQLLAQLYSQGELVEKNTDLAKAYRMRWIEYEAARSEFYLRDIPILSTLLSAETKNMFRYWKRRASYFHNLSAYIEREKLRSTIFESVAPAGAPKPAKLMAACKPSSPPIREMRLQKLDELSGNVFFFVGSDGRPDGMVVDGVMDTKLVVAALAVFDDALHRPQCLIDSAYKHQLVQLPFIFKLE